MQVLLLVSRETFFERVSNTVKLGVVKKVNTQKSRKTEKGVENEGKSVTHLTFGSTFCNMKMTIFLSNFSHFSHRKNPHEFLRNALNL